MIAVENIFKAVIRLIRSKKYRKSLGQIWLHKHFRESIYLAVFFITEGNPSLKFSKTDLNKLFFLRLNATSSSVVKCMSK